MSYFPSIHNNTSSLLISQPKGLKTNVFPGTPAPLVHMKPDCYFGSKKHKKPSSPPPQGKVKEGNTLFNRLVDAFSKKPNKDKEAAAFEYFFGRAVDREKHQLLPNLIAGLRIQPTEDQQEYYAELIGALYKDKSQAEKNKCREAIFKHFQANQFPLDIAEFITKPIKLRHKN
jgi:hypothetical protein